MSAPFRPHLTLKLGWLGLGAAAVAGLATGEIQVTLIAILTIVLTLTPLFIERLLDIDLPGGFSIAIAAFLIMTLVLGEVGDFYEKLWWWDVVLHAGSSIAFGLTGVVLMLVLLRGHKLEATPLTAAFFAFCFALALGALWEIWEFTLDQLFGLNTQKSGLQDTMWDLIVDAAGGGVGAAAGYVYLKGWKGGPLAGAIRAFVLSNRRLFPHRRR